MTVQTHAWLLRQDGPVTLMVMLKVVLVTAALLALTYFVLRACARRQAMRDQPPDRPPLQCAATLRLSAKTRVYLIRSSPADVLVTESATGISVTILPAKPASGAPGP